MIDQGCRLLQPATFNLKIMSNKPKRYDLPEDYEQAVPVHVVWETTLACNLNCQHCGSRAGKRRPGELSTEECFEIIRHLSLLGTREITLIGGEAFLRPDWTQIIERITESGIDCSMQSGAFNLNRDRIEKAKKAGIKNIGISIDGLKEVHDEIRGKKNSFDHAINALKLLKEFNIISSVNTVITQKNKNSLNELLDIFIGEGIRNWQVQLAVAMGNAVDNDHLLIQPYEIKEIHDDLFQVYNRALENGIILQPGNNIGYYGPYESVWRQGDMGHWNGCSAGHTGLGIEADGKIKGCPSLPTTYYTGGNIREMTLTDIWKHRKELSFTRYRNEDELWGFCKTCYYSDVCFAGCTWTSHSLFGQRGNNPYCYHRVTELEKKNLKERIVKMSNGNGASFDHGKFKIEVVNEAGEVVETQIGNEIPLPAPPENAKMRIPKTLKLCHDCSKHVKMDEVLCPFCGSDIAEAEQNYHSDMDAVNESYEELMLILDRMHHAD
jgi:radical SAM protein with 4Fe4S-binding SPASM domain